MFYEIVFLSFLQYYALEYLKRDFSTKVLNLFSYNYTNNPKITRAVLVALAELEKENDIIILDSLEQEEIIEKIKIYYYKNIKEDNKLVF